MGQLHKLHIVLEDLFDVDLDWVFWRCFSKLFVNGGFTVCNCSVPFIFDEILGVVGSCHFSERVLHIWRLS